MLPIEKLARRTIFVFLLALAPGLVFMIQVVAYIPPALVFSGVVSLAWMQIDGGRMAALMPLGFLLAHFLLLAGLYWILAFMLGKLVVLFRRPSTCGFLLALVLTGIAAFSQRSVFGGGGHGPSTLGPIQSLFGESARAATYELSHYLGSVALFALIAMALSIGTLQRVRQQS